jgi:DNA-binding NtrC family response regulator
LNQKILVVDDEVDITDMVKGGLKGQFIVRISNSFGKFINIIDSEKIDLVVTDMNISSKYSGLDVINYIEINHPYTKIIVMSGFYIEKIVTKYTSISKPFNNTDLINLIKSELSEV